MNNIEIQNQCPVCGSEIIHKKSFHMDWRKVCSNPNFSNPHYYENSNGKVRAQYKTHCIVNRSYGGNKLYSITEGHYKNIHETEDKIPITDDLDYLVAFLQNKDLLE